MKAVQISEFGGPEVLEVVELPDPVPGQGTVLVEVARAGMNFADTHQRHNVYLAKAELPLIPGIEVSGRTADGRRVAAIVPSGGYAGKVAVEEERLVPLPDEIGDDEAAAILVQGLSAWGVLHLAARLGPGESIVVGGAGGGSGSLIVQLASALGARVIALASSADKRELALGLGAAAAVDSRGGDLAAAIVEANGSAPVDVAIDVAGGDVFEACFEALAPFGRIVAFGIASRQPNDVRTPQLMRSSRTVAGFWLSHLLERPDLVKSGTTAILSALAAGDLQVLIGGVYPMSKVAEAQTALEDRSSHGKLLLDPTL